MKWLLAQPDDVLSGAAATVDFTYIYYALGTDAPLLDPWQGMVGSLFPVPPWVGNALQSHYQLLRTLSVLQSHPMSGRI